MRPTAAGCFQVVLRSSHAGSSASTAAGQRLTLPNGITPIRILIDGEEPVLHGEYHVQGLLSADDVHLHHIPEGMRRESAREIRPREAPSSRSSTSSPSTWDEISCPR